MFADEGFINKAQFDTGFVHRLKLKDGEVPAITDPGHDLELLMVSETASHVITLKCSSFFSSAHGAPPPGARLFSERIVKLYLSFINMIKHTFWRYEGCSATL